MDSGVMTASQLPGKKGAAGIRSCHVLGGANRNVGGPAYTVASLADSLARLGAPTTLVTPDYPWEGPLPEVTHARLVAPTRGPWTRRTGGWCPALRREMDRLAQSGMDVMHSHGLWLFPNFYAREVAVRHGLPLIIAPRGMVDAWSLRRSPVRKAIVWHLLERRNLTSASAFHATSDAEALAIRRLGFRQPIAVIPNGVDVPDLHRLPSREVLEVKFPELRGKHWLLFLSRLHPKKGLIELAQAWGAVAPAFADWRLVIAGPDEKGFARRVHQELVAVGAERTATFTGALFGREKAAALGHAGVFVLPTHSENFGVAVAEALVHGTPAIVTRGAPWEELDTKRCGWWIADGVPALDRALRTALLLGDTERRAMGGRGRALVTARYNWTEIARSMLGFYLWLSQGAERPACVHV